MDNCANPECPVPAGRRLTQPCLLNTGGMPDVIGSPCASFVPAKPPAWVAESVRASEEGVEALNRGDSETLEELAARLDAQPPVEGCNEVYQMPAGDWAFAAAGRITDEYESERDAMIGCIAHLVLEVAALAAQWAAVTGLVDAATGLVAEWESNVPEGNDKGVLGGMYAGCARQLCKAIGLERVTKGEGNDGRFIQ